MHINQKLELGAETRLKLPVLNSGFPCGTLTTCFFTWDFWFYPGEKIMHVGCWRATHWGQVCWDGVEWSSCWICWVHLFTSFHACFSWVLGGSGWPELSQCRLLSPVPWTLKKHNLQTWPHREMATVWQMGRKVKNNLSAADDHEEGFSFFFLLCFAGQRQPTDQFDTFTELYVSSEQRWWGLFSCKPKDWFLSPFSTMVVLVGMAWGWGLCRPGFSHILFQFFESENPDVRWKQTVVCSPPHLVPHGTVLHRCKSDVSFDPNPEHCPST